MSRGIPAPLKITATPAAGGTVIATRQPSPDIEPAGIEPRRPSPPCAAAATSSPPWRPASTGPLKLARWDHKAARHAEIRVFPDLHTARRLALAVARGRFRDQGASPAARWASAPSSS